MNQPIQHNQATLLGHPKGLFILILTEIWERFSYYGTRALMVLYLTDRFTGGLGWSEPKAYELYGLYTMSVYVLGILGGIIADRYLGQRAMIFLGAILACIGYFLLAIHHETVFMFGLCLISLGVGFFKINISTLVGGLYASGDPRRDSGFTLFYMGINLGILLASVVIGYIGQVYGWHYGFGLTGFGMVLALTIFLLGRPYLGDIGKNPRRVQGSGSTQKLTLAKQPFSREDKDRLLVLALSFIAVFIFFAAFEQVGGLLNLFTEKYTNRYVFGWQIPASIFQALCPAFILLLGPLVNKIWMRLANRYNHISSIYKMGVANMMVGIGFLFMIGACLEKAHSGIAQCSLYWLVSAYLFNTIGELCLSPVSLSFITKVAPSSIQSSAMGSYFATIGLASYLAAWLGKISVTWGELTIFQFICGVTSVIGIIFIALNRKLKQLTHGAEETVELENK